MNPKLKTLMQRLRDERGRKVIFLSHCILNENPRYWGGAFRKAAIDEVVDQLQEAGIGMVQMKCPGQVTNGILRQKMILGFGCRRTALYPLIRAALPLIKGRNKRLLRKLAREVVKEIKEYQDLAFEVIGIVGVSGSPFCSLTRKVDFDKSFQYAAALDLVTIDRQSFNEGMARTWVDGESWFITALKKVLARNRRKVRFFELDIEAERKGERLELSL